jgi:hypothetical protein
MLSSATLTLRTADRNRFNATLILMVHLDHPEGFVSDAGSGSGTLRLRRKIPLLFGEESLKTVCFDSCILKHALKQTRSVCLRAF